MIIDARNLNQNTHTKNTLPTADQEKAKELLRLLDKPKTGDVSDETEEMAPLQKSSRCDKLEISTSGLKNIQIDQSGSEFEMDYTKDTALTNAWVASQNTMFKLYGSSAKVSDEAVVGMDKEQFAEYMKTHELDKEIDWNAAELKLKGIRSYSNFREFTDYSAALYASLEDRIKTDFTGDEQTEQLDKLNDLYERTINKVIESVSKNVSDTYRKLGVEIPDNKLQDSIRQVMNDKKDDYRKFISKNSDYAGIKDSEDKWLARDMGYMANALRNSHKPASAESGELWNEDDLIAVGMFGRMYSQAANYKNYGSVLEYNDEENLGVAISMNWLATEKVIEGYEMSDDVKNLARGLFQSYADSTINRANIVLSRTSKNHVGPGGAEAFKAIDEKEVYAVLDIMKETYAESGDAEKAIQKMTSYAHDTFMSKKDDPKYSGLWRYNNEFKGTNAERYWGGFYATDIKKSYQGGMKNILKTWNRFEDAVNSKDLHKFMRKISVAMFRKFNSAEDNYALLADNSKGK